MVAWPMSSKGKVFNASNALSTAGSYGLFGGSKATPTSVPNSTSGGAGSLAGGGSSGSSGLFGFDAKTLLGLGATALAKPPSYEGDALQNYNAASKYLEGVNLPSSTMDQLHNYVVSPISDLKKQIYNPDSSNAALLSLDKQYQEALGQVNRLAANSGQSAATSSDVQNQVNEINRQWAEAKSNLTAQLDQQATTQAISIKQWALDQSIKQGQFDVNSAMELASQVGLQQQLQYAMDSKNYDAFQQIIAKLLDPGLKYTVTQSGPEGTTTTTYTGSGGSLSNILGK